MLSKNYSGSRLDIVYGLIVFAVLTSLIITLVGSFWFGFFTMRSLEFGLQVLAVTFVVGFILASIFAWFADMFEQLWFIPMLMACSIEEPELQTE